MDRRILHCPCPVFIQIIIVAAIVCGYGSVTGIVLVTAGGSDAVTTAARVVILSLSVILCARMKRISDK